MKAQIAIKLFGEDLGVLESKGRDIESTIRAVPGASDVALEAVSGEAQIVVAVNRDEMARFGINSDDVMKLVSNVAIRGLMRSKPKVRYTFRMISAGAGGAGSPSSPVWRWPESKRCGKASPARVKQAEDPVARVRAARVGPRAHHPARGAVG